MFIELMPVLQNTTVTLTISRIDDELLRVNVIPKRKTDKESEAEKALSTPLTVTATAAELDQDFARQVLSFSSSYRRSAANIREIEEAHAAAVKAAEEDRKNGKTKKYSPPAAKSASSSTTGDKKAEPAAKPVFGSKGQPGASPATQSLFDAPGEEAGKAAQQGNDGVGEAVNEAETCTGTAPADARRPAEPTPLTTATNAQSSDVARTDLSSEAPKTDVCGICKCPILPSQGRHSLMPFPAHASASDCEMARRKAS